jgi:hypothetical protein
MPEYIIERSAPNAGRASGRDLELGALPSSVVDEIQATVDPTTAEPR